MTLGIGSLIVEFHVLVATGPTDSAQTKVYQRNQQTPNSAPVQRIVMFRLGAGGPSRVNEGRHRLLTTESRIRQQNILVSAE